MKVSATTISSGVLPHERAFNDGTSLPDVSFLERWAAPVLVSIGTIPVLFSYFFLLDASLRLDEAQSLWQVSRNVSGILTIVAGDVHVPLYHLLLHYWLEFFGNSVQVARLFSLAFFVLSIPMLYLLAKRAYSIRTGLLVAFLFSISPFMNWYANEIRMYTLLVFLTILNQYCFVRMFKEARTHTAVWMLYAVSAILGVFTHYFFFLNLLAQAIFYAFRRSLFPVHAARRFMVTALLLVIVFAPWIWFAMFRGVVGFQQPLLILPSTVDLFGTFSQFLFGFQKDVLQTIFLSLWPLVAIGALLSLGRKQRMSPQTEYFGLTLIVAFGLTFIGSYLVMPVYVSRYLIFTLPALYLVLIRVFSSYTRNIRLFAQGTLIALMLTTLTVELTNPSTPVKEQYRSAAEYLSEQVTAQDVVLLSAPFTVYPVQYYYRGPAPITTLPIWDQYAYGPIPAYDPNTFPQDVDRSTKNYQNAYLLLSYDQGYEEDIKHYFDSRYQRVSAQTFSNDLNLYVYRLRYNTTHSAISAPL